MQPEADRFFPEISEKEYHLEASELRKADEKNPVDMRFEVWERNDASR
jgi:dihydrofolate reductase